MNINADLLQLKVRRKICIGIIKYLKREARDDPRFPDALAEYRRQLLSIRGKIRALIDQPQPVVIGLQTARLLGKKG